MKAIKIKLTVLLLGLALGAAVPVLAQSSKDTSTSTTKANRAGVGTGTLQDSDKASVPSGDAGVKQSTDQKTVNPSQSAGYWILGAFSLVGLIMLIVFRRKRYANP
jgi:cobalamin biosynthesis Mg chelatase CobN